MSEHELHEQAHHPELDEAGSRSTTPGNSEPVLARETYVVGRGGG